MSPVEHPQRSTPRIKPRRALFPLDGGYAAERAGKAVNTIKNWSEQYGIGRKIAGRWEVSKVALEMFLEGNMCALSLYLSGDREHCDVVAYFDRLGIPLKKLNRNTCSTSRSDISPMS